jgi:alkylhydroperoxidase family enzyme
MYPRIEEPVQIDDEMAAVVARTAPPGREPPGTISVLLHRPAMLRTFLPWATVLAREGALARRDHEILALRTSLHCRSPFEWGEHLLFARDAGLSDDDIDRIVAGPDADGWAPHEAALLRAADELHERCEIGEATWISLAAHYEQGQLVEIPYVVGQYTMLSMVANGLQVGVPAGFRPLPEGSGGASA